ncbi:MAG: NAD(P)/FAD-dependent oxidoreductase, partial [Ignavibacteria bacterium]|nr:NAD(P)/FAD-dependent oxidoreductase [Ignavibacteria bacterium]
MDFDAIVIGGGVVGLSCAYYLSKKYSVLLVERHPSFGWETSSRNSEVVHSGIYYPTGSLKAKLCVEGNKSLYSWCERYNVPYKKTGKLIVATEESELSYLDNLLENAKANGIDEVEIIDKDYIRKLEPYVKALAAIWVKTTGIVDSHRLMETIFAVASGNGCTFAFNHKVVGIEQVGELYKVIVETKDQEKFTIFSRYVINSAGLESDMICSLVGLDINRLGYELQWAKGNYFRIRENKKHIASRLIYPVPPKNETFLGIHLTIELSGSLKLGPDLVYLNEKVKDYTVQDDLREKFYFSAQKYLSGLELEDLFPDQAGIRPKLKNYKNYPDFIIKEETENGFPGFINLVGIESPGLTCCLE